MRPWGFFVLVGNEGIDEDKQGRLRRLEDGWGVLGSDEHLWAGVGKREEK